MTETTGNGTAEAAEMQPWLPDITWVPLAEFWEGTRRGELRFPRCGSCGRFQWYPQPMCPSCRAMDFAWTAVAPTGTVYSYSVVNRPFLPNLQDQVPFTVLLVDITAAPGVRLVTRPDPELPSALPSIGEEVGIVSREIADGIFLPFARSVPSGG